MVNSHIQKTKFQEIERCIVNSQPFVIPTETVYGLAAPADDPQAINMLYLIKNRPKDNPMICHFDSIQQIEDYIDLDSTPSYWRDLAKQLSPGPITYFLPIKPNSAISPALANMTKAGCRIPNHPLALEIIKSVGKPLAAPSANTSGRYSATNFDMVQADLEDSVDCFIDGGDSVIGIESTTIDCIHEHEIVIYRPGYIGKETIELALQAIGRSDVAVRFYEGLPPDDVTPGMKYKHYQPVTDLIQIDRDCLNFIAARRAFNSNTGFCLNFIKALEGDIVTRDCLNFIEAGAAKDSNHETSLNFTQAGEHTTHNEKNDLIKESDICYFIISNKDYSILENCILIPLDLKTIASKMYSSLFKLDQINKQLILLYLDPQISDLADDPLYPAVMNRLNKITGN